MSLTTTPVLQHLVLVAPINISSMRKTSYEGGPGRSRLDTRSIAILATRISGPNCWYSNESGSSPRRSAASLVSLFAEPFGRSRQSLVKSYFRLPSQHLPRVSYVRLASQMVSWRKWKMLQTSTSRRELNDLPCQINYPGLVLAPEVENIASRLIPHLCQKASDCICHVAERSRL